MTLFLVLPQIPFEIDSELMPKVFFQLFDLTLVLVPLFRDLFMATITLNARIDSSVMP